MGSTTPPEIDDLAGARAAALEAVEASVKLIRTIDSTLERIDQLMYVMQPFQSGRIGIKLRSSKGKMRWEARIFRQLRSRQWVSSYASHKGLRRRVKRSREWEANHKLLQLLCDRVSLLIQLRSDTAQRIRYFTMGATNALRTREPVMAETVALVEGMLERVEARFEGDMELDDE